MFLAILELLALAPLALRLSGQAFRAVPVQDLAILALAPLIGPAVALAIEIGA